ncbi:MAG: DUF1343 domain-containing protein [Candidatus Eremiobacteraeota bacterium]|nr:DUF1343 domain-containing protein [Candidatus Eremiobacteraeota bacterium]
MYKSTIALLLGIAMLLGGLAKGGSLPPARVTLGDEVFLSHTWRDLHGRCVGVITNQTGVTSRLINIVDAIKANGHICVRAIYSPEHGLRGDRPAGAYVSSYTDERTGLPVYSLYGPQKHPSAEILRGVDVLLFDIQDVGARPYTFVSTMAYAMEAAKTYGKEIWVLDRPNPVGGTLIDGPVLDPAYKSFIGLYPIAMRHGMTVGELARLFNGAFGVGAKLRVIPMRGWQRSMLWPDTRLQWVQTSPNIPEWKTSIVYLTTGLIDNAGMNGGIGTTKPFAYAGAIGLDAYRLASVLNSKAIPGVYFRPAYWSPFFGGFANQQIAGVELVVYDPRVYPAVRTAVELLTTARDISPSTIRIGAKALDTDWGTDSLRRGLLSGESAAAIESGWAAGLERFRALRARYLLYR